jgi:CRISPR-associated protein Csb2
MIDAFVVCEGPVIWIWPQAQISEQLEPVLTRLLSGVAYLGRAESRCSLWRDLAPAPANCRQAAQDSPELSRLARVLCLEPAITTEQLMLTTEQLRSRGALRPPSTRWRPYLLPRQQTPIQEKRPQLVTFLLQTRVPRQDTLRVADRVRRRLLSAASASDTLLGKTGDRPRADGHQHLHVLPGGNPRLPYLQRVDLWAPEGFAACDMLAIGGLTTLGPDKSGPPLRLLLWSVDDLSDMGLAREWRSYTPYLLARHPKSHGRDSPQEQLRRECRLRGWPEPVVNVVAAPEGEYQVRRGPRQGPPHPPVWMELLFPEPIQGPVCLGANAHFGMGRFLPLDAQEPD